MDPIKVLLEHLKNIKKEVKGLEKGYGVTNSIFHGITQELGLEYVQVAPESIESVSKEVKIALRTEAILDFIEALEKRSKDFIHDPKTKRASEAEVSDYGTRTEKTDQKLVQDIRDKSEASDFATSAPVGTFFKKSDEAEKQGKNLQGCMTCEQHNDCEIQSAFLQTQRRYPKVPAECNQWKPGPGYHKHLEVREMMKDVSKHEPGQSAPENANEKRKERRGEK